MKLPAVFRRLTRSDTNFNDIDRIWGEIIRSYSEDPRDVLTFGKMKYCFVYSNNDWICVDSGRNHVNKSKISHPRSLCKKEFEIVFPKYLNGARLQDIRNITHNSTYWFGIFEDMKLFSKNCE